MSRGLSKLLLSLLTLCTLLAGMMIVSPAQPVHANGSILFEQIPTASTDATTNAYTSTSVPFGDSLSTYEAADDFWGASDYLISHVRWYGVAAKSPYWEAGNPEGMQFQITFYQRNASTLEFTSVAQFSDLSPTYQTHNGIYPFGVYQDVQAYCFDIDLPSSVALTAGWISIQNTVSGNDGSTFLWLNSQQGNDNCISFGEFLGGEWDHAYFQDDLAFTLSGTTPRYYSVHFQAGANGSLTGTTTYADIQAGTEWAIAVPELPTPVPDFGYVFDCWSPSFPTTVNADVTYTANFVKDQDPSHWFTVSFREGPHGYVYGTRDFYEILTGTPWASAVEVPTPYGYAGYKFDSWSPAFPANVDASATYTANFVIDPTQTFTVTYDASGKTSGTVPVDATIYHSGDTVTVLSTDKLQAVDDYQNVYTCAGWMTNYRRHRTLVESWQYLRCSCRYNALRTMGIDNRKYGYALWYQISQTRTKDHRYFCSLHTWVHQVHSCWNCLFLLFNGSIQHQLESDWGVLFPLTRGKASLTINTLTSPGTYYLYGWFIPTDWESNEDIISNVWTVTIK